MGCKGSKDRAEAFPLIYRVTNVDQHGQEKWSGTLELTASNVLLHRSRISTIVWPFENVLNYGVNGEMITFELGRLRHDIVGTYWFRCYGAGTLFRVMLLYIPLHMIFFDLSTLPDAGRNQSSNEEVRHPLLLENALWSPQRVQAACGFPKTEQNQIFGHANRDLAILRKELVAYTVRKTIKNFKDETEYLTRVDAPIYEQIQKNTCKSTSSSADLVMEIVSNGDSRRSYSPNEPGTSATSDLFYESCSLMQSPSELGVAVEMTYANLEMVANEEGCRVPQEAGCSSAAPTPPTPPPRPKMLRKPQAYSTVDFPRTRALASCMSEVARQRTEQREQIPESRATALKAARDGKAKKPK